MSTSAFAQPAFPGKMESTTRHANVGATTTYTVGGGATSGFVWAIRSEGANSGSASISASTSNVQSVTWTTAKGLDVYYLDAYYIDSKGCYSDMLTYKVTITDAQLCIASTTTTVGGVSVKDADVKQTCSIVAGTAKTSGNAATAISTYGGDISTFYLTITGALPGQSYSVVYSVGGTSQPAVSITTDATGAGAKAVTVKTTDFPNLFENNGTASVDVTIAAVSATDINSYVTSSTCSYKIAVNAKPTISF